MDLSMSQITYHSRRRDQQQQNYFKQPQMNSGLLYYGDGNNSKSNNNNSNDNNSNHNIKINNNDDDDYEQEFSYGPIRTIRNYDQGNNINSINSINNTNFTNNNNSTNTNKKQSQSTISKHQYLQNLSNYSYGNQNDDTINNYKNQNKYNNYDNINMPSFSNLTTANYQYGSKLQQQQLHSFRNGYNNNDRVGGQANRGNCDNSGRQQIQGITSALQTLPQYYQQQHQQQQQQQQQTQALKQKLKTLTQHLKSALQANSEIEQKCNQLKLRIQEKQTKHMNELSVLKAQLIICKNQVNEKDSLIKQKSNILRQLQHRMCSLEQQNEVLKERLEIDKKKSEEDRKQIQQLKNMLINYEINKSTQSKQNISLITQKDEQIKQLKNKLQQTKSLAQQQINKKQLHITQLQQQLTTIQNSLQQQLSHNIQLKKQTQQQRNRINELNQNVKEICQNSQHLFDEINQIKKQNDRLKNKLQQKEVEKVQMEGKLIAIQKHLQQLSIANEQTITMYNMLQEKHAQLQQQNIQITTNNTSLLQQIQLLNQQIRQLKQLCLAQEMQSICFYMCRKQEELLRRVGERERERRRQVGVMPTRDVERKRFHTQGQVQKVNGISFDTVRTTTRNDSITRRQQQNQPRFDYLNNSKDLEHVQNNRQNISTNFNQPYSYLLSFELPNKQKVHTQLNTSEDIINKNNYNPSTKRRVSTCVDDRQAASFCYDMPLSKDYDLPYHNSSYLLTKNNNKNDRRSKSFYVERNNNQNDLLINQQHQRSHVYRSVIDPHNVLMREKQRHTNSIRSMRHSLDLREKSLDSRKSSQQNTTRQRLSMSNINNHNANKTNTQFDKIYTQNNIPQDSTQAKNMFFNKLDKMKLWAKQTVSQGNTQRQALRQINPLSHQQKQQQIQIDNNYFIKNNPIVANNRDTQSVQTIIKQKSNLMNQRKNLLTFNLNNQMIQKNILKLQKTNSSKVMLRTKEDLNTIKENSNLEGLSPIYQQVSNKKSQQDQKLTTAIYQNCKKMLYNHPAK